MNGHHVGEVFIFGGDELEDVIVMKEVIEEGGFVFGNFLESISLVFLPHSFFLFQGK